MLLSVAFAFAPGLVTAPVFTPALPAVPTQEQPVLAPHAPIRFGDDEANAWTQPFFPGATYDAGVADPERMLGQPVGSRLASHDEILRMLRAIAETSERAIYIPYGRTYEGRELAVCVITSPANHARLGEIQAGARSLWDPRELEDPEALIEGQPGIAWMGYGIHGDETSASEAAVPFAYHLAACTDPEVAAALEDVVVVLDPCLNPDGRERIRSMVLQSAGFRANLDDGAMQRGRWPGGRGNHFMFDMNRDWMAGEAPETRARWSILREYPPQLFVDAHEMSGLDTFLFYPQAAPRNAHLPERLGHWQSILAGDAGRAFDAFGWGYYTREWADALYPGYSDAWGSLTGAIGMLYEQGRTVGAPLERESGEIVAYRETVHGQIVASAANFMTFAANREGILRDYLAHRRKACSPTAPGGNRAFAVIPGADVERDARFLRTLLEQGIEVLRSDTEFTVAGGEMLMRESVDRITFPAGTLLVPTSQPQGALVRAYLEFDQRLDEDFLTKERESIERGRGSKIYDVTGWNLARQYGLINAAWIDMPEVETSLAVPLAAPAGPVGEMTDAYAWAADGTDGRSLRFAARAMELGLQVHVSDRDFTIGVRNADGTASNRSFPRGSFLLRRHENPDDVDELVARAATESRGLVFAVTTGRAPGDGPDLGGGHFELLTQPRVAILSNSPVSSTGCGHLWRYLDEHLGVPVTLVDAQDAGSVDLARYNVFVLPPGAGSFVRENGESLGQWVANGGTLVAVGSSAFAMASKDGELSSNRRRRDVLDALDAYAWRSAKERAAYSVAIDLDALYSDPDEGPNEGGNSESGGARAGATDPRNDAQSPDEGNIPQPDAGSLTGAGASSPPSSSDESKGSADASAMDEWRRGFSPAGVILRAEVDPESWLTGGIEAGEIPVHFAGGSVLMTEKRPALRLSIARRLRLEGLLWPEARARIADSAWLVRESRGRGQVISFAASPLFRGSWRGTARLFGNAVILGPGHVRPR